MRNQINHVVLHVNIIITALIDNLNHVLFFTSQLNILLEVYILLDLRLLNNLLDNLLLVNHLLFDWSLHLDGRSDSSCLLKMLLLILSLSFFLDEMLELFRSLLLILLLLKSGLFKLLLLLNSMLMSQSLFLLSLACLFLSSASFFLKSLLFLSCSLFSLLLSAKMIFTFTKFSLLA